MHRATREKAKAVARIRGISVAINRNLSMSIVTSMFLINVECYSSDNTTGMIYGSEFILQGPDTWCTTDLDHYIS